MVTVVSLVVVNWNAGERLAACVASVVRHPPSVPWELIVVDNASTDGSVDAARPHAPHARWVRNMTNRGLAKANNQGIVASSGDVVVFANPDVEFEAGTLDEFVAGLQRHPEAAFVVPRVRFSDGAVQTTAGDLPGLAEALAGRQAQWRPSVFGRAAGFCWDGWSHDVERPVGRAGDVCFAARRSAIATIGLQDEGFPLDWEAVEWSARARAAGFEIWFVPTAQLLHHVGTSTGRAPATRWVVQTHRGMYRYFALQRRWWWRPLLGGLFGARAALKAAVMAAGVPLHRRAQRPS